MELPQNIDAERAVLGAVLLDENAMSAVHDVLSELDFYTTQNSVIFKACQQLHEDKKPTDMTSVSNHLREMQWMKMAGGAAYLADLVSSLPDVANVLHHGKIVRSMSIKRGLIKANRTAIAAAESDWPVDQILEDHQYEIQKLQQKILADGEPEQIGVPAARAVERLESIKNGDVTKFGWKTGIKPLDSRFGYLAPKNLYVVAGGVSAGKSALVDQIADKVADDGGTVAIFCLEMSLEQRAERFLARRTNTSLQLFKDPQYIPDSIIQKLKMEVESLREPPILLDDTRGIKPVDILVRCKKIKHRYGLDLVVVDYLQLVMPPRRASREQEVAEMVGQFNNMAGELEVPVLLCSQLSRTHQHENRAPDLRDLRESGRIEADAFGVIMVHRPDLEERDCEILIRKNRQGPVGKGRMLFNGPSVKFEHWTAHGEEYA